MLTKSTVVGRFFSTLIFLSKSVRIRHHMYVEHSCMNLFSDKFYIHILCNRTEIMNRSQFEATAARNSRQIFDKCCIHNQRDHVFACVCHLLILEFCKRFLSLGSHICVMCVCVV